MQGGSSNFYISCKANEHMGSAEQEHVVYITYFCGVYSSLSKIDLFRRGAAFAYAKRSIMDQGDYLSI